MTASRVENQESVQLQSTQVTLHQWFTVWSMDKAERRLWMKTTNIIIQEQQQQQQLVTSIDQLLHTISVISMSI